MNRENVTNTKRKRKEPDWAAYAKRIVEAQVGAENARVRSLHIKRAERQLTEMGWSPESTQIWLEELFGPSVADEAELDIEE